MRNLKMSIEQRRAPSMEFLERRTLLSDASLKIPVFNYHMILPDVDNPNDIIPADKHAAPHNITETRFKAHLAMLAARKFQSLTPKNYLAWVNGAPLKVGYDEHVIRADEHAFMAIFDDSNFTDLRAAELMKPYNFTGVAAITTQDDPSTPDYDQNPDTQNYYVGNIAEGCATWAQIKTLASSTYKWEIASHSWDHLALGDGVTRDYPNRGGTAKVAGYFRNTPGELITQFATSRQDIIDNVFNGDASKAPTAFIHPFHDLTRRSLALAGDFFPVVFGKAFDTEDPANPPQYVGRTSDLKNGELLRVAISNVTTDTSFAKLLDVAMTATPFQRPIFAQHDTPVGYVASNGTIIIDGLEGNDTIVVNGDTITLPLWDETTKTIINKSVTVSGFRTNHYKTPVTLRAYDISGGRGNDKIAIVTGLANTTAQNVINGNDGADTISGSPGPDIINGGAQPDVILGNEGNDVLRGNGGNDKIYGNAGADRLYGYNGNDLLDGGSSGDRFYGGDGADTYYGQSGADKFFAKDGFIDHLFGGKDKDFAEVDASDVLASIESIT